MLGTRLKGKAREENGHASEPLFDVDEDGEVLKSHHRERSDDSVGVSKDVEDRYSSETARLHRTSHDQTSSYPPPHTTYADSPPNRWSAERDPPPLGLPSDDYSEEYLTLGGPLSETAEPDEVELKRRRARWLRESAVTGIFVLLWYLFATLLSLYNKWMFSPEYYGFSYPLFVTSSHMVVQFILASVVRVVWRERYCPKEKPGLKNYGYKIVPTAAATAGDIGLSNLSLKTITLTLYTMVKSSALVFVLGFAFLFHLEVFSLRLLSVILLISFGVFLMVFDATTVSIPGIIMVFSASALGGLRWAFTQLLMHKKEMGMTNPFATIFWLTPVMAVALAVVSMAVEGWGTIFASEFFHGVNAVETTGFILFPGTLAFSMVASEYFIIQRAGIVPLSIAGIFKEVSTITISSLVFGDQLTAINNVGVVITIGGIALYSFHKYQKEMQIPSDASPKDEETFKLTESPSLKREENGTAVHHVLGDDEMEDDDDDVHREREPRRSHGEAQQLLPMDEDMEWQLDGETSRQHGSPISPIGHHGQLKKD